jgi:hypothetical protein
MANSKGISNFDEMLSGRWGGGSKLNGVIDVLSECLRRMINVYNISLQRKESVNFDLGTFPQFFSSLSHTTVLITTMSLLSQNIHQF